MSDQEPPLDRDPRYDPDPRIDRGRTAAAVVALGGFALIARGALDTDRVTIDLSKLEIAAGFLLVSTVIIVAGDVIRRR